MSTAEKASDTANRLLEGAMVDGQEPGAWSKRRSGSRFEMALRKGAARAGLQVPLESQGCSFRRELDGHVQGPWAIPHRMRTTAGIVVGKAIVRGPRHADVEVRRFVLALQDVDDALGLPHAVRAGKVDAGRPRLTSRTAGAVETGGWADPDCDRACGIEGSAIRGGPPTRLRRSGAASFACQKLVGLPSRSCPETAPARLRGGAATARHPSREGSPSRSSRFSVSSRERRMVDLTGIEPVTS